MTALRILIAKEQSTTKNEIAKISVAKPPNWTLEGGTFIFHTGNRHPLELKTQNNRNVLKATEQKKPGFYLVQQSCSSALLCREGKTSGMSRAKKEAVGMPARLCVNSAAVSGIGSASQQWGLRLFRRYRYFYLVTQTGWRESRTPASLQLPVYKSSPRIHNAQPENANQVCIKAERKSFARTRDENLRPKTINNADPSWKFIAVTPLFFETKVNQQFPLDLGFTYAFLFSTERPNKQAWDVFLFSRRNTKIFCRKLKQSCALGETNFAHFCCQDFFQLASSTLRPQIAQVNVKAIHQTRDLRSGDLIRHLHQRRAPYRA